LLDIFSKLFNFSIKSLAYFSIKNGFAFLINIDKAKKAITFLSLSSFLLKY
jgi:hypothetical protein